LTPVEEAIFRSEISPAPMSANELFTAHSRVLPEWVDYNGHLNMGYYMVAFDRAGTDGLFNHLGVGIDHVRSDNKSMFSLGANIDYIRELMEGDPLRITCQVVDFDHKRLHFFQTMYHAEAGFVAATNECLSIYVDLEHRRSTTFSDALMARFEQEREVGAALGVPERFGRTLGIRGRGQK
jgi:acyl-CoA thioester hydrolase